MKAYLEFVNTGKSASGLTEIWEVHSKNSTIPALGRISWYGAWRKYCFYPFAGTLFDSGCLTEIGNFITDEMKNRKQS